MFGFPLDLFGSRRNASNNALMIPSAGFPNLNDFFNDFSSPFAMMDRMMRDVQHHSNEPIQSFTSTTVMSFNGPNGQPKIYQESTASRRGPGGIEETRQTVRDSERGINKVKQKDKEENIKVFHLNESNFRLGSNWSSNWRSKTRHRT